MIMLNIEDIKELIVFCKTQKVKRLKISDVEFELSDIAIIEETYNPAEPQKEKSENTLVDSMPKTQKKEEEGDDLLFWSSNP